MIVVRVAANWLRRSAMVQQQHHCRRYKHQMKVRTFLADRGRVRDFISLLSPDERRSLFEELRDRHPELLEPPTITVVGANGDASTGGSQCPPPTMAELNKLAFAQSLPFIGFGFLDNLLMILAGDYIDLTIGVTLGISTMAAAGLGNALSDMAGVGSAYYVERLADNLGVRPPKLTMAQLQMTQTRWATQIGRAIGVLIGCLIGMFPLLFLPHRSQASTNDNDGDTKNGTLRASEL